MKIFVGDEEMVRESSTTPRQGRKQTARAIMFLKRERKKERKKRENAVRMIEGGPGRKNQPMEIF